MGTLQASLPLNTLCRVSSVYPLVVLLLAATMLRSSPRGEEARPAADPATERA